MPSNAAASKQPTKQKHEAVPIQSTHFIFYWSQRFAVLGEQDPVPVTHNVFRSTLQQIVWFD